LTIVVAIAASTSAAAVAAKAIGELMVLPLQNPKDEANCKQLKNFKISK
jgi:hypothetical protein